MLRFKLNLRTVVAIAICLAATAILPSCDRKEEQIQEPNFHNLEHRIGLWINSERNDTLHFISDSKVVRKGQVYQFAECFYEIENDVLIIHYPLGFAIGTHHPILKAERDIVILDNMYIGTGFGDKSETFVKQ